MKNRMFGVGLRHPHHEYVLKNKPQLDFVEVHTENFIAQGGGNHEFLQDIAEIYPISFHCVGMSLGSASGLNKKHLQDIKNLVELINPILLSDHLSWSDSEKSGTVNDLLPVPYSEEALQSFCDNVNEAQDFFGRQILVENPSAYLEFVENDYGEVEFLNKIAQNTGCGILLDINNVFVSCENFKLDAVKYLDQIDVSKVKQIHLAGHSIHEIAGQNMRIDTHSDIACDEVVKLFQGFIKKYDPKVPILYEWDEQIPEFEVLYDEMLRMKSLVS